MEERQVLGQAAVAHRRVDLFHRHVEGVARPVVAVDAVHGAPDGARRRGSGRVAPDLAPRVPHLDLVDRLPLVVGEVADAHAGVDVPVDPLGGAPLLAAHPHEEHGLLLGVGLVVAEARDDLDAVAHELARPVALLAGLARRAQIVDRRGDRPRIDAGGDRHDLSDARELGLDEPSRPRPDVTVDAADVGVGGALEGGELGLHHAVAGLAAELGGVHGLDPLVGGGRQDHDVQRGQHGEDEGAVADPRVVEVEHGKGRRRLAPRRGLPVAPALAEDAEGDQQQAGDEQGGEDQIGEDAGVRPALETEQLEREQGDDQNAGCRDHRGAEQADRIARQGDKEALHGMRPSLHRPRPAGGRPREALRPSRGTLRNG